MSKPTWNSRDDFPHLLSSMGLKGIGVEVGVQTGRNLAHIRRNWEGRLVIGVDPWKPYGTDVTEEMHDEYAKMAMAEMRQSGKDYQLWRMESVKAAQLLQEITKDKGEGLLDWVFLDGDHSYEGVIADIEAWYPLVKSGGILSGHDWVVDGWHRHGQPFSSVPEALGAETGPGPFYVRKAVLEKFKMEDLSITSPDTDLGWQSFLLVKP